MPETIRDRMKDVVSFYLTEHESYGADDAYETASDIADDIFDEFTIPAEDQGRKGQLAVFLD